MRDPHPAQDQSAQAPRKVTLELGDFAWEAIDQEASRAGSTIEEIVAFSVLYYLADVDSGRIARSRLPLLDGVRPEDAERNWTALSRPRR